MAKKKDRARDIRERHLRIRAEEESIGKEMEAETRGSEPEAVRRYRQEGTGPTPVAGKPQRRGIGKSIDAVCGMMSLRNVDELDRLMRAEGHDVFAVAEALGKHFPPMRREENTEDLLYVLDHLDRHRRFDRAGGRHVVHNPSGFSSILNQLRGKVATHGKKWEWAEPGSFELTEEWIKDNGHLSKGGYANISTLVRIFGDRDTVKARLRKAGLKHMIAPKKAPGGSSKRVDIKQEELKKLLEVEGLSPYQAGKRLGGITPGTIKRRADEWGIAYKKRGRTPSKKRKK